MRVVVALGSNIDPARHIPPAVSELASEFGVLECSKAIQTEAIDRPEQDDYWNAVVRFDTELSEEKLHDLLRAIEARHGRLRGPDKWAARTLDLDIVLYGEEVDDELRERDFLAALVASLDGGPLDGWPIVWQP